MALQDIPITSLVLNGDEYKIGNGVELVAGDRIKITTNPSTGAKIFSAVEYIEGDNIILTPQSNDTIKVSVSAPILHFNYVDNLPDTNIQEFPEIYVLMDNVTGLYTMHEFRNESWHPYGEAGDRLVQGTSITLTDNGDGTKTIAVDIDDALNTTSEKPVQNKVIKAAIDGVGHTLFYNEDESELQLRNAAGTAISTVTIAGGSGSGGVALAAPTSVEVKPQNQEVWLKWTDPENVVYAEATLATWKGTAIVRKTGSAPSSISDGILVANVTEKNSHVDTYLVDSGLVNGTTYYYGIFPYTTAGVYTTTYTTSVVPRAVEIVTFAEGTDAQIAAMLAAHYDNVIDITEYWAVGNTRKIHLNEVAAPNGSTGPWAAQDITIVITAMNHHNLATPINEHTKAAITCQTRECLNNLTTTHNTGGHMYINGDNAYDQTFTKWSQLYMRTWLNGAFLDTMMPTGTKSMIKPITHNILTTNGINPMNIDYQQADAKNGTKTDRTTEPVTDTIFLPTYPEIFGNVAYEWYLGNGVPNSEEGTQWQYYETAGNRIKYGNNNGASNGTAVYWWEGSSSSLWYASYGYIWCYVTPSGTANTGYGSGLYALGLAPAFAM